MGPFFERLANYLVRCSVNICKVHFNGGDEHFYRLPGAIRFAGGLAGWAPWLRDLLLREHIDAIVLFGQARPLHRAAIEVAGGLGIPVFVFEEGYIRPHYVTLEIGGVNGHTSLPREVESYRDSPAESLEPPRDTRQRFGRMAWYAVRYAFAAALGRRRYPGNKHHRDIGAAEAARWIRGGWRKLVYAWRESDVLPALSSPEHSKQWFLLALQVHNDAQIREHSPFADMRDVIRTVMASFAAHASATASLVIKHHPMDRAHRDYAAEIAALSRVYGLHGQVHYVHDLHLPTLLKHARGVVTVNSTTGVQAMYHGTPVCALGECLYALPGLVHDSGLDTFWGYPAPVDAALYRRFHARVVQLTQLNASFYGEAPGLATREPSEQPLLTALPAHRADMARVTVVGAHRPQPANASDDDAELPRARHAYAASTF
jgi:capsular polysaccharide export protein